MISFTNRAYIQINTLKPGIRKQIEQAVKKVDQAQEEWEKIPDVQVWIKPEGIYMIPVGPSLRVFFEKSSEGLEVLDIIPQARIDAFQTAIAAQTSGNG